MPALETKTPDRSHTHIRALPESNRLEKVTLDSAPRGKKPSCRISRRSAVMRTTKTKLKSSMRKGSEVVKKARRSVSRGEVVVERTKQKVRRSLSRGSEIATRLLGAEIVTEARLMVARLETGAKRRAARAGDKSEVQKKQSKRLSRRFSRLRPINQSKKKHCECRFPHSSKVFEMY